MTTTMGIKLLATCLLATFIAIASLAGQVRAEGLRQDALKIPAVIAGPMGSTSVELEAIVVRPDDGQSHPLAILNHGSPRMADQRPKMSPYVFWAQAAAFARRGWVTVVFLRRGYGQSGGEWAENWGACSHPDYASAGRAGASDIAAVAKFMRAHPMSVTPNGSALVTRRAVSQPWP
jgi:hypothetical protein